MKHRESTFKKEIVCLLPRIWRFGMSLAGTHDACNDLVQATCERALTHFQQWEPGTKLDSWVFTIMHSIWVNELRAQSIRRGAGFVDPNDFIFDNAPDQESQQYAAEILRAANALPEAQRTALLLVYVEGYTYKEAAAILDIPIGTVMSRLARARVELADRLYKPATKARSLETI